MARQIPLTCSGHTRPVVHLSFSDITPHGYFLISACKGKVKLHELFYVLSLTLFKSRMEVERLCLYEKRLKGLTVIFCQKIVVKKKY